MRTSEIFSGISKHIGILFESANTTGDSEIADKPKIRKVDRVIGHREEFLIHNRHITEQTIYESKHLVKPSEAQAPNP